MNETWRSERFAPASGTRLARVADIADGSGREFVFGDGKAAFRIAVFRDDDAVRAYVNRCPHFGIPLNVDDFVVNRRRVFCVSHYARFRIRDGFCEDGPCEGASLEAVPVEIEDGAIVIR